MSDELYIVAIAALLPLTAGMLVTQKNPYHALVIRGIVGAVAALVYALFGAADVALTEALVGTMLSITLYAIAVRSSMSLRLGVLAATSYEPIADPTAADPTAGQPLMGTLRQALRPHHLRLEVVPYTSLQALQFALENKEIHATCVPVTAAIAANPAAASAPYHLNVRLRRLFEIVQPGMPATIASVSFSRSLKLATGAGANSSEPIQNAWEGQP